LSVIIITAQPCWFSRWAYYWLCAGNFKPSEEEEREFFSFNTTYHYHGITVSIFALGLLLALHR